MCQQFNCPFFPPMLLRIFDTCPRLLTSRALIRSLRQEFEGAVRVYPELGESEGSHVSAKELLGLMRV